MQSEWLPLSYGQQRLWFLDQLDRGSAAYNVPRVFRVNGRLNLAALGKSLKYVIQRHQPLRAVFTNTDGEPRQAIQNDASVELPVIDLSQVNLSESRAKELVAEEVSRPFRLDSGPPVRFKLIRLHEDEHLFILTMHHLVTDGWSMSVFFRETAASYEAFAAGREPDLPPLAVQYADYVEWQHAQLSEAALESALSFWAENLKGRPPVLELPADRLRPSVPKHHGQIVRFYLDDDLTKQINVLCRSCGATLFMALLAAFKALLSRYTGTTDVVIGTPVAGREEVELEGLVGFFVNTLVLRTKLADDPSFRGLLRRVRETALSALAHAIPFERIVQKLQPERNLNTTPLIQVMFLLQNMPRQAVELAGLEIIEELDFDAGVTKFDLTLEVVEDKGLHCSLEYNSDIFDRSRIERLASYYETLLRSCVQRPDCQISELDMLPEHERNTLICKWNNTQEQYPKNATVHELFEAQVDRALDDPVLIQGARRLTAAQVEAAANRLANHLLAIGAQRGDLIAICMERSIEAVISLLAVLKTGAAYVPVDPHYPRELLDFVLKDCSPRVLLTQQAVLDRVTALAGRTVVIDRDGELISAAPSLRPNVQVSPNDAIYAIYTSGSTGMPKGVLGTHRAALNRFTWMYRNFPFEPGESCCQKTTLGFVDSVWETFGPLIAGVPLYVFSDDQIKDTEVFVRELSRNSISRLTVVPSLLRAMLEAPGSPSADLARLRFIFSSGEALPPELFERCRSSLPNTRVVNLYGSSEVAGDITYFDSGHSQQRATVPIGRPISNTRVYIVDRHLKPVPIGVPGELLGGGDCVAKGYLRRDELTAARFISDPFMPEAGARVFRTGDLAKYREDGEIEFLGRLDHQIKLRGTRIEPEEIEFALAKHESVQQAVVTLRGSCGNENLVAFVVPTAGLAVVPAELRRWLRNKLPETLIPAAFVAVDSLPLTLNGKIDRSALPSDYDVAGPEAPYVAPRNETERRVAEIWSELLKIDRVSVYNQFFDCGGHSLLAAQVISRIRRIFRVEVPLRALFEEPTVAALAIAVQNAQATGAEARQAIVKRVLTDRESLLARLREMSDDELDALLKSATTHGRTLDGAA